MSTRLELSRRFGNKMFDENVVLRKQIAEMRELLEDVVETYEDELDRPVIKLIHTYLEKTK